MRKHITTSHVIRFRESGLIIQQGMPESRSNWSPPSALEPKSACIVPTSTGIAGSAGALDFWRQKDMSDFLAAAMPFALLDALWPTSPPSSPSSSS
eukprot:5592740-Prymnesium_polylepis.1